MEDVVSAFGAHHPAGAPATAPERDRLRAAIEHAHATARAAWPTASLSAQRFAEELAKRAEPSEPDLLAAITRLHASDLYLAIACADRDPGALAAFERSFVPDLRGALGRMRFESATVDEALQAARVSLLVGDGQGPPRILEYGARGHLGGWLRVVVLRVAYKSARAVGPVAQSEEVLASDGVRDIELDFLQKTYGDTFKAAFRVAMAGLPLRERLLLKQRYAMQMTVVALGAQHGVNASTISRWVADARARLVIATRNEVMARLQVGAAEVSSILRVIELSMDTSLLAYREPSEGDLPG